MSKRYNIAYLISHKTVGYPLEMQNGVRNAIEEQGHNLINFMDLLPSNNFLEWSHNNIHVAFKLAAQMDFDAYIVPVGVANAFISNSKENKIEKYLKLLDPNKTILMEEYFEGYRCIKKDNKPGMRKLICHLIEQHGYRRIGFISGPESSFGARERESVYFEEMERHGIAVEDGMFARGVFSGACEDVAEEMLARVPDIEAIVCASDHIAETVYRILKKHSLTPGKDIAVTGFDDIAAASEMTPPLTTVRLSAYEMAYKAGYEVVRLCEGNKQEIFALESSFVHRLSCGETIRDNNSPIVQLMSQNPVDLEAMAEQLMEDVSFTASTQVKMTCLPRFRKFVRKVYSVLMDKDYRESGHIVDQDDIVDIFHYDYMKFFSLEKFCEEITDCYEYVASRTEGKRRMWITKEQAYFQKVISKNIAEQYSRNIWEIQKRQHFITRITMDALMYSDDQEKAIRAIFDNILQLGIKDAVLLTFKQPIEYYNHAFIHMEDTMVLRVKISDGEVIVPERPVTCKLYNLVKKFMTKDILNRSLIYEDSNFTVGPLLTGRDLIGVFIMGPSNLDSTELERIYQQIAVGMQHLELIKNEQELITVLNRNNLRLSRESEHDELTGAYNRRGFMNNLEQQINGMLQSGRYDNRAVLYYMDMDGLKYINDTFGHDDGDFAIKSITEILTKAFEKGIIGRQGGDEFLGFCFMEEMGISEPAEMIMRVESIMDEFNADAGKPYKLNISIGYCEFNIDSETMKKLPEYMEAADVMLYENKRRHKALCCRLN